MAALNPALGHYVYRLRGKRFEYSFEDGLSARATYDTGALSNTDWPQSEPVNEQIFDSSFSGVVSSTLTDQTSSEGKTYRESGNDPYDIDTSSKKDVLDMSVNDTDIYGSYY